MKMSKNVWVLTLTPLSTTVVIFNRLTAGAAYIRVLTFY